MAKAIGKWLILGCNGLVSHQSTHRKVKCFSVTTKGLGFLLFQIVSDSYFILREYNGEFLPWSHVTMVRILHLKYSSFHYKLFITM